MSSTTTVTTATTTTTISLSPSNSASDFITKAQVEAARGFSSQDYGTDPDNQPDPWQIHSVDLHALESGILHHRPLYSRSRLQRYADVRDRILSDKSFSHYFEKDVQGYERCLWMRESEDDDFVQMNYLTYVELHPDMHVEGERSPTVAYLHDLNPTDNSSKEEEDELLLCPVTIESGQRAEGSRFLRTGYEDHLNATLMAQWRDQIVQIRRLWESSTSFRRLRSGFQNSATHAAQIKKIVCFGLGRLQWKNDGSSDHQEVLQHITAFSIAAMLNDIYHAQEPSAEPIKIVLQDPLYTEKDRILLREAYSSGPLSFVADPDGFLEVDNNTLVIAPYINIACPVMQICADLCRPAGFLCDSMDLDPEQSFYTWRSRASPRVATMLKNYRRRHFDGIPVEREMFEDVCGGRMYWLWDMNLWLKPKGM